MAIDPVICEEIETLASRIDDIIANRHDAKTTVEASAESWHVPVLTEKQWFQKGAEERSGSGGAMFVVPGNDYVVLGRLEGLMHDLRDVWRVRSPKELQRSL